MYPFIIIRLISIIIYAKNFQNVSGIFTTSPKKRKIIVILTQNGTVFLHWLLLSCEGQNNCCFCGTRNFVTNFSKGINPLTPNDL
jgi:hypothetical protein